jgi:hypothetical protein
MSCPTPDLVIICIFLQFLRYYLYIAFSRFTLFLGIILSITIMQSSRE